MTDRATRPMKVLSEQTAVSWPVLVTLIATGVAMWSKMGDIESGIVPRVVRIEAILEGAERREGRFQAELEALEARVKINEDRITKLESR